MARCRAVEYCALRTFVRPSDVRFPPPPTLARP
jgi:hypothetical protein